MPITMGTLGVSKWQLALIVGTPLAVGAGLYFYNQNRSDSTDTKLERRKQLSDKNAKSLSIDGQNVDKELEIQKKAAELAEDELTPHKEAINYKNEGNSCYRSGKFDEAISFYDKAIDKCPAQNKSDLSIFYQNRAAAYEMLKKWSKVLEDCSRSLELNPRYAKAYLRRAKAYEANNNLLECLNDITATCILEMFQNNSSILFADRVLKQTGYDDAKRFMSTRDFALPSKGFIKTYMRSYCTHPIMQFNFTDNIENAKGFVRARILLDSDDFDQIIPACTEEIESSEAESQYKSEALLLRGTFYILGGNYTDALQDLDALINDTNVDEKLRLYALIKRASLHIQRDEKDEGLADFNKAEEINKDCADIYHQRAQFYILFDQIPEALEQFERVVALAPTHAMAFVQKCYAEYRLALISQDNMRLFRVMNDFKRAIEIFPDCTESYSLMAQVLSDQQQYEQADQFYEKAMKIAPTNAALHVHRGIMQLQWKGDVESAIKLMLRALEIDEKCELAYETLGTVEVQRANLERAVELFNKAIELSKNQSEMAHLFALRNAANAQITVTQRLGIDMNTVTALAQASVRNAVVDN